LSRNGWWTSNPKQTFRASCTSCVFSDIPAPFSSSFSVFFIDPVITFFSYIPRVHIPFFAGAFIFQDMDTCRTLKYISPFFLVKLRKRDLLIFSRRALSAWFIPFGKYLLHVYNITPFSPLLFVPVRSVPGGSSYPCRQHGCDSPVVKKFGSAAPAKGKSRILDPERCIFCAISVSIGSDPPLVIIPRVAGSSECMGPLLFSFCSRERHSFADILEQVLDIDPDDQFVLLVLLVPDLLFDDAKDRGILVRICCRCLVYVT